MEKEDLLNLGNNKNPKKVIIYIAVAFLIFVVGVIAFALFSGNAQKENNVIPPQDTSLFKEIPVEVNTENNISEHLQLKEDSTNKPAKSAAKEAKSNNEKLKPTNEKVKATPQKLKSANAEKKIEAKSSNLLNKDKKYYIQVAAFIKYSAPNKKLIEKIKKYGFNYKIYTVTINKNGKKLKVHKLLIGPFDKKEIKKELIKVKKYINKNAFIFKVK